MTKDEEKHQVVISTTRTLDSKAVSLFCKGVSQDVREKWYDSKANKAARQGLFVSTWIDKRDLSLKMFDILCIKQQREDNKLFKVQMQKRFLRNQSIGPETPTLGKKLK